MNDNKISKYYVSEFTYTESNEELSSISIAVSRKIRAFSKYENIDECDCFLLVTETDISNKDNPDDAFHIKLVVKFECLCDGNRLSKGIIRDEYCPYVELLSNRILKDLTEDMKIAPLDLMN